MRGKRWFVAWLLGIALFSAAVAAAQTDPTPMPIPTPTIETPTPLPTLPFTWISPTPDETGTISVIVQAGESLWIIAARAGLTLPELLALNNLTEADVINPGDVLIIGQGTPGGALPGQGTPSGTPSGSPPPGGTTPTRPPPTPRPTETPSEAAICLLAFDDVNRDGVHDEGEPLRAGVAFTIYNTEAVVANYVSDGVSEPRCLRGLLPGEYRVTRSIAPGEVLTTSGDWALSLTAGSELRQEFGSVVGAAAVAGGDTGAGGTTTAGTTPQPTPAGQPANVAPPTAANPQPTAAAPTAATDQPTTISFALDWRVAGVAVLFLGGLLLMGAVLLLLFRPPRGTAAPPPRQESDATPERRFRDLDDL